MTQCALGATVALVTSDPVAVRAARHAALGEPVRLAIVDELARSDRSPVELRRQFQLESNLLTHHLGVLEEVGLIGRSQSSGDGRRRYIHLDRDGLPTPPEQSVRAGSALFVCTRNSARSQLAAALWAQLSGGSARSAGTHPADEVHRGALRAAARAGLDLGDATPHMLGDDVDADEVVVTVCDQAHEELCPGPEWLHWSVPDPVCIGTDRAFDTTLRDLRDRIRAVLDLGRAA